LKGDGDFRSDESIELLKEADIVVTNPPFSMFREYLAQLIFYRKNFIIIGNVNCITYKEVFPLIKDNKMWMGASIHSGDREFRVPDSYPLNASGTRIDEKGNKYIRVKGVRWFTNLDYNERHEDLDLYKEYNSEEYPKYDNYDAINVNKTAEIPCDYDGVMGVPITFLDKYNPDQFEIIGLAPERLSPEEASLQIKRYMNAIQHKADGTTCSGNKVNDGPTLLYDSKPSKFPYYTSETVPNKYIEVLYARILIKRR